MRNSTAEMDVTTSSMAVGTSADRVAITPSWIPALDVPLLIFYLTAIVCGAGNCIIALTVVVDSKLRRAFNALVAILSCVYGLLTLVVAPMELVELSHKLAGESWVWCKWKLLLRTGCFFSAMLLLLVIAIIRMAHGLTTKKVEFHGKHVCLIAVVIAVPILGLTIVTSSEQGILMLTCVGNTTSMFIALDQTYELNAIFITTVAIFICTVVSYVVLIITLKVREGLIRENQNQPKRKFHIVTGRVAFWVITGFVLSCMTPFVSRIVNVWYTIAPGDLPHAIAAYNAAIFIQATIHPFIHFRENPAIRKTAKWLLLRRRCNFSSVGTTQHVLPATQDS